MKRIYLFYLLYFIGFSSFAQNGLEGIIVEKYYVSDKNDTGYFGGKLPIGSVTYRVFVDLLPRYRFQAVYGIPTHKLSISTSTLFFNNEDKGAVVPNVIPDRNLNQNSIMLDSWLSVGAASEANYCILKMDDKGDETIVNKDGMLQNDNKEAGIPIKIQDGLSFGRAPRVTAFGIDSIVKVFNNRTIGSEFSTTNGSWASLYGSVGPDSLTNNRVIIGQFTTDGDFSFELNIQIGTPFGSVQNYVAKNPQGIEIELPSLSYNSQANKKGKKNKEDAKSK